MADGARLSSVDVYRGLVAAVMVLAVIPGPSHPVFESLQAARAVGWTGVDLIAPAFLFIAGIALALSPRTAAPWRDVVRRVAILWLAGVTVSLDPSSFHGYAFLWTPLATLALAYGLSVAVFRFVTSRTTAMRLHVLALTAVMPLVAHWAIWRWWHEAAAAPALSLLPAVSTMLAGAIAGVALTRRGHDVERVAGLIVVGGLVMVAALGWDARWRIDARAGSGSFTLLAIGICAIGAAACHWFVDVRTRRPFAWLVALGRNALPVVLVAIVAGRAAACLPAWGSAAVPPEAVSLGEGVAAMILLSWIAHALARRGIYLRA